MRSQLLFGELVQVLEQRGRSWCKVRCTWDNTIGWVSARQVMLITEQQFEQFKSNYSIVLENGKSIIGDFTQFAVPIGSCLPGFDGLHFKFNGEYFHYSGQAVPTGNIKPTLPLLMTIARRYLHTPFLPGGRSPLGVDSAGMVQMIFKVAGIHIPRLARQQVVFGHPVDFFEQAKVGDLAFFENKSGKINHVGLIFGPEEILHVRGSVRVDKVDHFGIFNLKERKYTHRLRIVKRVFQFHHDHIAERNTQMSAMLPSVPENQGVLFKEG